MALTDTAVFTAARGFIFTAPVDTAAPTPAAIEAFDANSPTVASWENLGHTALDELPEFGFDGGDTEVRGTWQNQSLREVVTEAVADFVTFNAHQFDEATLSLYYGVTSPGATDGKFDVGAVGSPLEKALLVIIVDGSTNVGFHALKSSIRRNDAISLDTDGFAFLPLRATFLKPTSGPLFSWISLDTVTNDAP